jgi:REP element-mobilizing transposase RayT
MPYRKSHFVAGGHYHIFSRGNNRQGVFLEPDNYVLFLRLIRKYLADPGVADVLAYCLMPNHYHLFLRLRVDDLSRAMQAMLLSYTRSFNNRFARTGSLFQGRFKAVLVQRDAHWSYLTAYIHRNPVEAGLVPTAEAWPFSSYREYLGLRKGTLVRPEEVWEGTPEEYRLFVGQFTLEKQERLAGVIVD